MCTKTGRYCEKEKKSGGGGHSRCKWSTSEAFVKFKKKSLVGEGGQVRGGVGGGGGVRVYVNGEVTLF